MSDLCIVGDGYLHQILNNGNQSIARICRIQPLENTMRHESLWIDCLISGTIKVMLGIYQADIDKGRVVKIQFSARYLGTEHFQCCLTDEDPDHIISMKAEMLQIFRIE